MKASSMFPSKYLKAADLGSHEPIVTISEVSIETLGQEEEKETKPVLYFEGKEKGLVCNVTNWNTLISHFGDETNLWIGKRIKLITAEVNFKGKMSMALRISLTKLPQNGSALNPKVKNQQEPTKAADEDLGDDADTNIPF